MKTAQAGTLESMDCLVTLTEAAPGAGISIEITGAGAARFRTAMEKKIKETLEAMGVKDINAAVQDNGALDIVLGARVEAAFGRMTGGKK